MGLNALRITGNNLHIWIWFDLFFVAFKAPLEYILIY
jgi:hypothetical protein